MYFYLHIDISSIHLDEMCKGCQLTPDDIKYLEELDCSYCTDLCFLPSLKRCRPYLSTNRKMCLQMEKTLKTK